MILRDIQIEEVVEKVQDFLKDKSQEELNLHSLNLRRQGTKFFIGFEQVKKEEVVGKVCVAWAKEKPVNSELEELKLAHERVENKIAVKREEIELHKKKVELKELEEFHLKLIEQDRSNLLNQDELAEPPQKEGEKTGKSRAELGKHTSFSHKNSCDEKDVLKEKHPEITSTNLNFKIGKDAENIAVELLDKKIKYDDVKANFKEAENEKVKRTLGTGLNFFDEILEKMKGGWKVEGTQVEVKGENFLGYIDFLLERDGEYWIIDTKAHSRVQTTLKSMFSNTEEQLNIYAHLFAKQNKVKLKNIQVAMISANEKKSSFVLGDIWSEEIFSKLMKSYEIRRNTFQLNTKHCSTCDYANVCEYSVEKCEDKSEDYENYNSEMKKLFEPQQEEVSSETEEEVVETLAKDYEDTYKKISEEELSAQAELNEQIEAEESRVEKSAWELEFENGYLF
jgi:hypothetical protein